MVDLQNLRNAIDQTPFSEDVKKELLAIVDKAIARGGTISAEEKKKLLDVIDLDLDRNELDKEASEEVTELLGNFEAEVDNAAQTAADNVESIQKEEQDKQTAESQPPSLTTVEPQSSFGVSQPQPPVAETPQSPQVGTPTGFSSNQ